MEESKDDFCEGGKAIVEGTCFNAYPPHALGSVLHVLLWSPGKTGAVLLSEQIRCRGPSSAQYDKVRMGFRSHATCPRGSQPTKNTRYKPMKFAPPEAIVRNRRSTPTPPQSQGLKTYLPKMLPKLLKN
eukprot:1550272-Amphidinium_carterae.2